MKLIDQLSQIYGCKFDDIELLRDWIGQVYIVKRGGRKYICKVFRQEHTGAALQSSSIMNYLKNNAFLVPTIMVTENGNNHFLTQEDSRVGILYEYVDGREPERSTYLKAIGKQVGYMRKLMELYRGEIYRHDDSFFIKRYITILEKKKYEGTDKFEKHGYDLWNMVRDLPIGFCHGDMHTGNMILSGRGLTFFDFVACSISHPLYDIATSCDGTDYFDLSDRNFEEGLAKTKANLDVFLQGYSTYYNISEADIRAIFNFIAIRHYDIQATIIESQGLDCVDPAFFDDQYRWLMKWKAACEI